jgi:hypothetical protein
MTASWLAGKCTLMLAGKPIYVSVMLLGKYLVFYFIAG